MTNRDHPVLTECSHFTGLGTTFGYLWWYGMYIHISTHSLSVPSGMNLGIYTYLQALTGFHLPRVRVRDTYYARLEKDRAEGKE